MDKGRLRESIVEFLQLVHAVRKVDEEAADILLSKEFFMNAKGLVICGNLDLLFQWSSIDSHSSMSWGTINSRLISTRYALVLADEGDKKGVPLSSDGEREEVYGFIKLLKDLVKIGRADAAKKILERIDKVHILTDRITALFEWVYTVEGTDYWEELHRDVQEFRWRVMGYEERHGRVTH